MADVLVEVPDALTGFLLSRRLRKGDVVCADEGGWIVSIDPRGLEFPELVEHVLQWMRQESIAETTVSWNGKVHHLKSVGEAKRVGVDAAAP